MGSDKDFTINIKNILTSGISIVGVAYAYVTLLNIIYILSYYKKFDINIFEYFEPSDILIGAFSHSELLLSWAMIIFMAFPFWVIFKKFTDKKNAIVLGILYMVTIIVAPFMMEHMYVQEKAYEIIYVKENYKSVQMKNNKYEKVKLIGSAGNFHFYYQQNTKNVFRINESEIISIENETPLEIHDERWWANYIERKLIFDKRQLIEKDFRPVLNFQ